MRFEAVARSWNRSHDGVARSVLPSATRLPPAPLFDWGQVVVAMSPANRQRFATHHDFGMFFECNRRVPVGHVSESH